MDFNVSADPPHVVEFRKEVAAWVAEQMKGHEHLRWSASWSTREDDEEYKFRRGLAEKLGAKGWLFPLVSEKIWRRRAHRRSSDGVGNRAVQIRLEPVAYILHSRAHRRAGADSLGNRRAESRILAADHAGRNLRLASVDRTPWRQRHRQLPDQGDPRRRSLCRQRPKGHGRPPSAAGLSLDLGLHQSAGQAP